MKCYLHKISLIVVDLVVEKMNILFLIKCTHEEIFTFLQYVETIITIKHTYSACVQPIDL